MCENCSKKCYDIPEIQIIIKGGIIQEINIPFEEPKVKIMVKDYDVNIQPDSEEAKDYNIKEDKHGVYEEGLWSN